jgi:hypothetical protein
LSEGKASRTAGSAAAFGGIAPMSAMVARGLRASALAVLAALLLSACAASVTAPVVVKEMAPANISGARITDVVAEAMPGVVMYPSDLDRVISRVRSEIAQAAPGALVEGAASGDPSRAAPAMKLKLLFTRYDAGNAFARFMLAGLGQIRIDADVIFLDGNTGETIAKYQVSKDFSFGGIYGGTTRIEDVEVGFAKSVAEILKNKKV